MPTLKEIASLFLKLGFIGFGGPAAHIAMMREEVVHKKQWLSDSEFLDLISITNLIPGPNSTELAIHIGYSKRGWKGLIIAGLCFILPAVFITGLFAFFYKSYGHLPEIKPYLMGIQPAIIAIILVSIYPLLRNTISSITQIALASTVVVATLLGFNELWILITAIMVTLTLHFIKKRTSIPVIIPFFLFSNTNVFSELNQKIFLIFLKVGAILYGSGYVLFAFLETELVGRNLLTQNQLIDAIAVGQFTPGPVFSSVSFIGYQINGISGMLVSTIAIFLPSFCLVAFIQPLVQYLRRSELFSKVLTVLNIISLAFILSVSITMSKNVFISWQPVVIFIISLFFLTKFKKLNSVFIVLGGAFLGYLFSFLFIQ